MSALELYLKKAAEELGLRHIQAMYSLRAYLKLTKLEDLLDAIKLIEEPDLLRLLWEAGLPAPLQRAVLDQLERLTARHGPPAKSAQGR